MGNAVSTAARSITFSLLNVGCLRPEKLMAANLGTKKEMESKILLLVKETSLPPLAQEECCKKMVSCSSGSSPFVGDLPES